ncbi:MAG: EAL domain-containing protein [Lachnospiraceae bacterium]|nr:EAL domain-containing protein [Lachnospiraceae bacterium]
MILISGRGLSFDNYRATEGLNLFIVTYVFFVGFIAYLLIRYRARVIRQILKSIFLIFGVCIVVFLVQGFHRQTSYTTFIFLIPIIAILYLMHSNPYDQATGVVNEASFNYLIKRIASSRSEYVVMSLLLFGFEHEGSFTDEMRLAVYQFGAGIAKNAQMFKAMGGHLLFVFPREKNPDYKTVVETLRLQFDRLHSYFHITFKAVFLLTNDSLNAHNEYSSFISFIEERMPMNTYYWVNEEDLSHFEKRRYIISQLEDISRKKDLDDERVLVYCQPVYNVETGRYDTAEALMRLTLKDLGMVNPDQFIPVAEEETLIHSLSRIILNKTCKAIAELQGEGYLINRISINFSMLEVRDDNFCSDMIKIIQDNEISPEKIAIELTESRNLEDFEMVKKKIGELKDYGIKFYLDDFGTGYSNFERIMEIPFDIIKFDRSLVIEASKNEHSAYMVSTFADMFCKLKYHVLYEGVENESDEKRCIKMQAQYLQGFKYSRPIPIGMLRNFLIQQK